MIELYSIETCTHRCPGVAPALLDAVNLSAWTVRKGGSYYTFCDLVAVKAAKDLLAAEIPLQRVRKAVESLKKALPNDTHRCPRLRVFDGNTIVALHDDIAFEPIGGQIVMAFNVPSFGDHISEVLAMPRVDPSAPQEITDSPTEANSGTTAYRMFVEACAAEDRGDLQAAEHMFRQGRAGAEHGRGADQPRQPRLSPGRSRKRAGTTERSSTTRHQPEARSLPRQHPRGPRRRELAVAELRKVCALA